MSGLEEGVDRSILSGLLAARTPDDVYERVLEACTTRLGTDRCTIAVDTDDGLEPVAVDVDRDTVDGPSAEPLDYRSLAIRDGESYLIDDLTDTRSTTASADGDSRPLTDAAARSLLCVPIGELGVVAASSSERGSFSDADREWLEALVSYVESALSRFSSLRPITTAVVGSQTSGVDDLAPGQGDECVDLEDLEERLSFVLDATDSILWTVDVPSRTLQMFGPVERMIGLERNTEYPASRFVEGFVHPDDRDRLVDELHEVAVGSRTRSDLEYRVEPKDNDEIRWFRTRFGLLEGEEMSLIGLSTDVTEHVTRERRIKHLQQRTTRLISARSKSRIANIAVNAAGEALSLPLSGIHLRDGDRLEPTAVNERLWDEFGEMPAYHRASDDPLETFVWDTLERGRPAVVADTNDHDRLDEVTRVRSLIVYPLDDYGVFVAAAREPDAFGSVDVALGEVLAMGIVAALDRSEQERQLRDQAEELERKNERLEEFTSIVSHDLRNPLNVALGRVEYVRSQRDDEHLETAEQALERMEAIIEETLVLARQGHEVTETSPVSLPEMVEQCWQNVRTEAATLVLEFDGDYVVAADRERLAHVFENFITNAVQHGGDTVTIRVGPLPDRAGFYVEDDGPGITPADRATVFETGYTTDDDGTGFGLSLVRDIVQAHGWRIGVTEGPDGGARFEISDVE
jgi:signal transduction histidine kinase